MLTFLAQYGPLDRAGKYAGSSSAGYSRNPGAADEAGTLAQPVDMHTLLDANFWDGILFEEVFEQQATMFQPIGGMDRIPYAFAKALGDTVHYNSPITEIRRTWRLWVIPGMLVFLGVTSPIIAALTPALVQSMTAAKPGVVIHLPTPGVLDASAAFLKNIDQFVLIAVIIAGAGAISGERSSGTAILALTIAIALRSFNLKPPTTAALTLITAAALALSAYHLFHQPCDEEDTVQARVALFQSNQGTEPTDEYTPNTADNDSLAPDNPPYWLSPDPNAKPPVNAQPGEAPIHLTLNPATPETLILNLRDYPAWHITRNQTPITTHIQRDDGLIALPLPAGPSTIDIHYAQTLDQTLGDILSLISLTLFLFLLLQNRRKPLGYTQSRRPPA